MCTKFERAQKNEKIVQIIDFLHKAEYYLCRGKKMNKLPFDFNYDDIEILKALNNANSKLGELNGLINVMPNPNIILNAIILSEAKESSEIENIVTTYDEIFKELTLKNNNLSSKEVVNYREAVLFGFKKIKENGFISTNIIEEIHHIIEPNVGGIRKIPGTVIMNTKTNKVLHTPPQNETEIRELLTNLENYINYKEIENIDPLIKMAIIHYQFECIHPFYDGNGRTGRIINILYLNLEEKLSLPILYLSKYINNNRDNYYKVLQEIKLDINNLKQYLLFMIKGIEETSIFTLNFINNFRKTMKICAEEIKERCPKIYSEELVNYLFYDFYTKNEYIREELNISRNTASKYLNELEAAGILISESIGKEKIYKNSFLYELIKNW